MLSNMVSPVGALEIVSSAPQAGDAYAGGVAVSPSRQIRTSTSAPQRFDQGRGLRNDGALCVDVSGSAIVGYVGGLPVTADGSFKGQLNATYNASDTFVSGVRVGVTGGVHVTSDRRPPLTGVDGGFSSGFGI